MNYQSRDSVIHNLIDLIYNIDLLSIDHQKLSHDAKRHLLDSLGCAIGAINSKPTVISKKIAPKVTDSLSSTIIGHQWKTTPEYAAFSNTIMVRYLDYNDTGIGGHPSDMIPAILALAEPMRVDGKKILEAIIISYEVVSVLRKAGFYKLRNKHVDQIQNVIGSAVGAGIILDLNEFQMANAISLAVTPSVPIRVTRTGTISDWKGCATAHSSMMGVLAARLAKEGLTGPELPFDGISGLRALLNLEPFDFHETRENARTLTGIEAAGFKLFPAEYSSQGPLHILCNLHHRLNVDDIKAVEIGLHWGGWHEIGGGQGDAIEKWNPKTRESADHSMPFLAAIALLEGSVNKKSFSGEKFQNNIILEFMKKIYVYEDTELTKIHSGEIPKWPSIVKIKLNSGEVINEKITYPKGHPFRPASDEELEKKFIDLSLEFLSEDQISSLLNIIWNLDQKVSIEKLMAILKDISFE